MKTTYDLIDNLDYEKIGELTSEFSERKTRSIIKHLRDKWYEEDEGYYMLEYLANYVPQGIEICEGFNKNKAIEI